jgi:hypothetical protein
LNSNKNNPRVSNLKVSRSDSLRLRNHKIRSNDNLRLRNHKIRSNDNLRLNDHSGNESKDKFSRQRRGGPWESRAVPRDGVRSLRFSPKKKENPGAALYRRRRRRKVNPRRKQNPLNLKEAANQKTRRGLPSATER